MPEGGQEAEGSGMKTMGTRVAVVGVAGLVGLLVGLGIHSAVSQGVRVVSSGSDVGRYQLVPAGNSATPYVYFLDTKTGRCWLEGQPGSKWTVAGPLEHPDR